MATFKLKGTLRTHQDTPAVGAKLNFDPSPDFNIDNTADVNYFGEKQLSVITNTSGYFEIDLITLPGITYQVTGMNSVVRGYKSARFAAPNAGVILDLSDITPVQATPEQADFYMRGPAGPPGPQGPPGTGGGATAMSALTDAAITSPATSQMLVYSSGKWTNSTPATVKSALSLDQVNNTPDSAKPVSTAQSTAINAVKARNTHTGTQSADTVDETATRLWFLDTERLKLGNIAAGATVNSTDAALRARSSHTGTQTSSTISDFTEAVQDAVALLLTGSSGVTLSYDDAANTLTITGGGSGGGLDAEAVRDAIGIALVGTGVISVVVNDAADTITISSAATQNDTDANLKNRANHTGVMPMTGVAAGAMLVCPLDGSVNTSSTAARPSARTDIFFRWRSTVQPTNMITGDEWYVVSP